MLNLASVAGKAIVWKAALDALPGQRPARYGHVVPALFIGFLLNTVLFARVGELARVAVLGGAGGSPGESIPASTIAGTALAEQLVLGVALALAVVALAPVLHLPHMIWQLLIVFMLVLAAVVVALMIAMRKARGRFAQVLAAGLSRGQALFSQAARDRLAMAAGTLSWAAQIAGIWAALEAFDIHVGLAGAGLVFVSSTIVQLFPFWPGNLGIFQLGVARAARQRLRGLDRERRRLQRRPASRRRPPRRRPRTRLPGPRGPLAERRPPARDGAPTPTTAAARRRARARRRSAPAPRAASADRPAPQREQRDGGGREHGELPGLRRARPRAGSRRRGSRRSPPARRRRGRRARRRSRAAARSARRRAG